jgi:dTMP kinase
MQESRGLFIVLEGSDGSGKSTQFNLLKERLGATGYDVEVFDFPRYDKESSHFVRSYLKGEYGPAPEISPYTASLFYALDRYEAAKDIKKALKQDKIVLADRYVAANMAYQGSKFDNPAEQRGFFVWEDNLEFELLGIPRPDITFFLRVPAHISKKLIEKRALKTGIRPDSHEKDTEFLKKSVATYDLLCQLFPKDFKAIDCTKDGKLQSVAEINNIIWEALKPILPKEKPRPSHSVVVTLGLDEPVGQDAETDAPDELTHTFKNASVLLKLQLQRSKVGRLSENSDDISEGRYDFYTPRGIPKELQAVYKTIIENILSLRYKIYNKLSQYTEKNLLANANNGLSYGVTGIVEALEPLSALSSFSLRIKKNEVNQLAGQLLASDLDEVQWAAKQLYLAARQKWPEDFQQPLESAEGPESLNNIIAKLASERLPRDYADSDGVKLLEARPRLEFDLLAESIYPFSNLPLEEIAEEVSNWPYIQKYESLKQALSLPGILSKIRYKLDIISDQMTLNKMVDNGKPSDIQIQAFTPRYGFEVPDVIENAGLDELYNHCFDESLKLYSLLQGAEREDLAPYATLMGHKVRWQLNADAKNISDIVSSPDAISSPVIETIAEKISEVHPLLWEIISGHQKVGDSPVRKSGNRVKPYHQRRTSKDTKRKRP